MLLGVVSDTHGMADRTRQAVRVFQRMGVTEVIHCGDIGGSAIVSLLSPMNAHFVLGNCDNPITIQLAAESAGHGFHGRLGQLERVGRKIAFLHGDSYLAMQQLLAEGAWDLICHGHTHCADMRMHGKTMILNPGALARCEQPSIALVRLPELQVTPIPI